MSIDEAVDRRPATRRGFPPVAQCCVASLVLVVVGGIWMATYFPRRPPLALPALFLILSVALLTTGVVLLARIPNFAWQVWAQVWRWALLAYVVVAALIEFAFAHNGARGAPLALVTAMLVIFTLDVPTIIAFTVARYQKSAQP